MISLILLIMLGIAISRFALQNPEAVTITIGTASFANIPLYLIVLCAILAGSILSWLLSLPDELSSVFTLQGKDAALRDAQKTIDRLKKRAS